MNAPEVLAVMDAADRIGYELGASVSAMCNEPSAFEMAAARRDLFARFRGLEQMATIDAWDADIREGWHRGKRDPAGAKARVEIKRADARQRRAP